MKILINIKHTLIILPKKHTILIIILPNNQLSRANKNLKDMYTAEIEKNNILKGQLRNDVVDKIRIY